jgi:hypothetical protein
MIHEDYDDAYDGDGDYDVEEYMIHADDDDDTIMRIMMNCM